MFFPFQQIYYDEYDILLFCYFSGILFNVNHVKGEKVCFYSCFYLLWPVWSRLLQTMKIYLNGFVEGEEQKIFDGTLCCKLFWCVSLLKRFLIFISHYSTPWSRFSWSLPHLQFLGPEILLENKIEISHIKLSFFFTCLW